MSDYVCPDCGDDSTVECYGFCLPCAREAGDVDDDPDDLDNYDFDFDDHD